MQVSTGIAFSELVPRNLVLFCQVLRNNSLASLQSNSQLVPEQFPHSIAPFYPIFSSPCLRILIQLLSHSSSHPDAALLFQSSPDPFSFPIPSGEIPSTSKNKSISSIMINLTQRTRHAQNPISRAPAENITQYGAH